MSSQRTLSTGVTSDSPCPRYSNNKVIDFTTDQMDYRHHRQMDYHQMGHHQMGHHQMGYLLLPVLVEVSLVSYLELKFLQNTLLSRNLYYLHLQHN